MIKAKFFILVSLLASVSLTAFADTPAPSLTLGSLSKLRIESIKNAQPQIIPDLAGVIDSYLHNPYRAVTAGFRHTCGLREDRSIVCWGWNEYEQTTVPAGAYTQVAAGGYHTCGLREDGSIACWGWNDDNQTTLPPLLLQY